MNAASFQLHLDEVVVTQVQQYRVPFFHQFLADWKAHGSEISASDTVEILVCLIMQDRRGFSPEAKVRGRDVTLPGQAKSSTGA